MRLPLCMMDRRRERMPSVNRSHGLLTALGLATGVLAGCATTATTPLADSSCCHFVYRDGRMVRVDYRRGGRLSPDPTSGVATIRIEHPDGVEKRVFLDAGGRPIANHDGAYAVALKYDDKGNPI